MSAVRYEHEDLTVHEDKSDSVLPAGIALSAVVVCLLIATAYLGSQRSDGR